jgi:hypothetical protein
MSSKICDKLKQISVSIKNISCKSTCCNTKDIHIDVNSVIKYPKHHKKRKSVDAVDTKDIVIIG